LRILINGGDIIIYNVLIQLFSYIINIPDFLLYVVDTTLKGY